MSLNENRPAIAAGSLARRERGDVVFSKYVLEDLYLPKDIWDDPRRKPHPESWRLKPLYIPPYMRGIFVDPTPPEPTIYRSDGLQELFETIEREQIIPLGLSTLEDLASKDPRIIPKVQIELNRLWLNVSPFLPEDVLAEFRRWKDGLTTVDLLGISPDYSRLIMRWKLSDSTQDDSAK